jgi:hypothetical protein
MVRVVCSRTTASLDSDQHTRLALLLHTPQLVQAMLDCGEGQLLAWLPWLQACIRNESSVIR